VLLIGLYRTLSPPRWPPPLFLLSDGLLPNQSHSGFLSLQFLNRYSTHVPFPPLDETFPYGLFGLGFLVRFGTPRFTRWSSFFLFFVKPQPSLQASFTETFSPRRRGCADRSGYGPVVPPGLLTTTVFQFSRAVGTGVSLVG